ncbi:hypothetical protein ROLI_020250 [Roseobacter fucihabitans]|uniref:Mechanosensitive ion channel family protein n=1 Tax=Roseobacter fucihabitans TaxID=1537242 RepID=A0ABZ2BUE8_9RHOB|nr:DUF3772 domain-containing protein [Roseobacter litoralis]MBC6966559.1 putative MscS family protein.1 precursor [Roseobacter litoralis]
MSRFLHAFAIALIWLCAVFTGGVTAQNAPQETPDYKTWEQLADLTEKAIDTGASTNEQFEVLRQSVVNFRARFATVQSANEPRISALKRQIEALGPVPEAGEEAAEIATRRAELEGQLQELQAPVQVALAAFQRADAIVGEIDSIIRDRQTKRLLSLGASPVNPSNWPIALKELEHTFSNLSAEISLHKDPERRRVLRENAPLVLFLLTISLIFIFRGRAWAGFALSRLRAMGGRGSGVWRFLVSLFRIIIPLIGVAIFAHALRVTGLAGERINLILDALPVWAAFLLGFRWLAERLFSRDPDDALILLTPEKRAQARFLLLLLSVFLVVRGIIRLLLEFDSMQPEGEAVLAFPIMVLIGVTLACIGQLMRGYVASDGTEEEDTPRGTSMVRAIKTMGTGLIAISVIAPLMAAVGYSEAGNALLYPAVSTMLVLGGVAVLNRFAADVYGLVTGMGVQARDALFPIFVGFFLLLASLPILALAWGARVADLTELWSRFTLGFAIGDTRISPGDFLTLVIIFAVGYGLTRLLQNTLRVSVLPKTQIDIGGQNAIVSGLGYFGIFLAGLLAVTGAGLDLSSLAIVAGALSVGIGFGLQTVVSNFVSGIILLIERPISEGDWIEVGGQMGYVRDISVRSTRIETFDRTDVIVPNADLVSGTVTNYTRGNKVGRLIVSVGVAYGTDTRRVEAILKEIVEEQPMVLRNPAPMILFNNFGADALEFELRMILRDVNWIMNVKNDINHAIAKRFSEENIEIPFAQRDVWLRNAEVLKDPVSR